MDEVESLYISGRRRLIAGVAAATVVLTTILSIGIGTPAQAQPSAHDSAQLFSALSSFRIDESNLSAQLSTADSEIAVARKVLADSAGKTLDAGARIKLAGQLTIADENRAAAAAALSSWKNLMGKVLHTVPTADLSTTTHTLNSRRTVALSIDLTAIEDVNAAVAAWNAEQARQAAAAAEAAAEAQAAADAAAAAAARPRTARVASASSAQADSGDKMSIALAVFARYGFSNVVFDGGQSRGHYAATDMNNQIIYVQLSIIPTSRVASVALHEYQHILQARAYGGYGGAVAYYGSVAAMESAADCGALAAGATWVNYGCH